MRMNLNELTWWQKDRVNSLITHVNKKINLLNTINLTKPCKTLKHWSELDAETYIYKQAKKLKIDWLEGLTQICDFKIRKLREEIHKLKMEVNSIYGEH